MSFPEDVRKRVEEAVKQGKLVIVHPRASKIFKGDRVEVIDYPKTPPKAVEGGG